MANCLVTKLKSVVDNNNLLKLDEFRVTLYAGYTMRIKWNGFNSTTCQYRVVSGNITPATIDDGYDITANGSDCVLVFSNKKNIKHLISANGENLCIMELDANQFHGYNDMKLEIISRCKLYGDITPLYTFAIRSDNCDFTNAKGNLDIYRMMSFSSMPGQSDVSIITHTNIVNAQYLDAQCIFKAGEPISLSSLTSSALRSFTLKNVPFSGNIETDLQTFVDCGNIILNGNIEGRLEKWIEKMANVRAVGKTTRVQSTSTMTLVGRNLNNSNYLFHFNTDDITITIADYPTVVGRYTKSTQTWAWED